VDKKNTLIGSLLLVAAFVIFALSQKYAPQQTAPAEVRREVAAQTASEPARAAAFTGPDEPAFVTTQTDRSGAAVTTLSNGYVDVDFTDAGGAIRDVAFKKYPAAINRPDPFIFNQLHSSAMMAFVGLPGLDHDTRYELVSKSASAVVYRAVLDGRLEVTRRYVVSPDSGAGTDPYIIRCETTVRNLTDRPTEPMRVALSIGTAAPNNALDNGQQLSTEFSNGKDQNLVQRRSLEGSSGLLGFWASDPKASIVGQGPIVWATVKNQFFAAILTPDEPAASLETRRIKLLGLLPDSDKRAYGLTATVGFDLASVPGRGTSTLAGNFYVGPKEYPRLSNSDVFKKDEDRIMDFGMQIFRFCAATLLLVMNKIHGWTGNWGVAIILTTLTLKVVFLPITLAQSRSSRRMQKLMPEMTAIREKFKDNPQKQQLETMELYKKHKVNPLSGCLPMLLTIPFFWAFFRMLQGAAELRFAHFLWARDLSAPDTVGAVALPIIGVISINVLPILLGAVNFLQVRVMPQPTVDNAQTKMMKFMPVMFVLFYYSWPCAISIYSTVNGLFTIGQQLVVNRIHDPAEDAPKAKPGKPAKNVTPRKGR
jgi:YidC/Oxa1 family membrane protein insertase